MPTHCDNTDEDKPYKEGNDIKVFFWHLSKESTNLSNQKSCLKNKKSLQMDFGPSIHCHGSNCWRKESTNILSSSPYFFSLWTCDSELFRLRRLSSFSKDSGSSKIFRSVSSPPSSLITAGKRQCQGKEKKKKIKLNSYILYRIFQVSINNSQTHFIYHILLIYIWNNDI